MTTLYSISNQDIEVDRRGYRRLIDFLIVYDVRDLRSIHFPKGLRGGSDHAGLSWHSRDEMPNATIFAWSGKKRSVT